MMRIIKTRKNPSRFPTLKRMLTAAATLITLNAVSIPMAHAQDVKKNQVII